ncbi:MAG: dephospho-CoA kinase [Actinomycetaceae bacterium]|nr:dephospho-CoA kinase [Actinomycetaceae bacterium]
MPQIVISHGDARAIVDLPIEQSGSVPTELAATDRPLWIGLSGGIGAGKSTVTATWEKMGATIADADEIGRELMQPGTESLAAVVQRFGEQIAPGGVLDRAGLAKIVFSNEDALADLNALMHPRIRARALEILQSAKPGGLGVYDAAILIEAKMTNMVDAVAIVVADEEQRVERLVSIRGMSEDDARRRIANQMSDEQRRPHASIVLENHGTIADLEAVAREVYTLLIGQR